MKQRKASSKHQHGAVLVVSLLILLVMTIIGMTAMQTTTLEEKMAGNARDHNLAFQAAEAAVREAELVTIQGQSATDFSWLSPTGPLLDQSGTEPNPLLAATWTGANTQPFGGTALNEVATQPRFYLKYTGTYDYVYGGSGVSNSQSQVRIATYRITARGTGGSNTAIAVVRTNWGRVRP